jgi:hypothetical protein
MAVLMNTAAHTLKPSRRPGLHSATIDSCLGDIMATNIACPLMESAGGNSGYVFIREHALLGHHGKRQSDPCVARRCKREILTNQEEES